MYKQLPDLTWEGGGGIDVTGAGKGVWSFSGVFGG